MKRLGIVLIIIGVIMFIWTGFRYTKKETIVDAGPVEINADKEQEINWPPYIGAILIGGGVIALLSSSKVKN
jgi:uncharacterized membrane protein YdcZ (DUF606 family)